MTSPAARSLDVVMCVDERFVLPLAVTLSSLERSMAADGCPIIVHVLHSGLSDQQIGRVTAPLRRLDVRWYRIDGATVEGAHYPPWISPATLFRLHLSDLLPAGVERVLYLDADIVVRGPIDDALTFPLDDAVLAAVRDGGCPWAARDRFPCWQELGMAPSAPYFNAGILLIDVSRWRSERVGERCLEILRRTQPYFADQDALNAVLENRWTALPRRWNVQTIDVRGGEAWALWPDETAAAVSDPLIVHYTEADKPWNALCGHPLKDYWLEAVQHTDWADWTPPAPRTGSPVVNRLVSFARELRGRRDARLTRSGWS